MRSEPCIYTWSKKIIFVCLPHRVLVNFIVALVLSIHWVRLILWVFRYFLSHYKYKQILISFTTNVFRRKQTHNIDTDVTWSVFNSLEQLQALSHHKLHYSVSLSVSETELHVASWLNFSRRQHSRHTNA